MCATEGLQRAHGEQLCQGTGAHPCRQQRHQHRSPQLQPPGQAAADSLPWHLKPFRSEDTAQSASQLGTHRPFAARRREPSRTVPQNQTSTSPWQTLQSVQKPHILGRDLPGLSKAGEQLLLIPAARESPTWPESCSPRAGGGSLPLFQGSQSAQLSLQLLLKPLVVNEQNSAQVGSRARAHLRAPRRCSARDELIKLARGPR